MKNVSGLPRDSGGAERTGVVGVLPAVLHMPLSWTYSVRVQLKRLAIRPS